MSAVWDRLKSTGPSHNGGSAGGGSARGAYYGHDASRTATTSDLNFNNGAKYSYSIKGGPAPPRPPREFVEQQQQKQQQQRL